MLVLKDLSIYRGKFCVLEGANLSLQKGKVYALLGANGAGKSSLMKAIFGEIKHKGEISFAGETLNFLQQYTWRKSIGYMPQDNNVDVSLSVLEVVLLGLMDSLGVYIEDEKVRLAAKIMQELGIIHLAQRDIMDCSGGQRQMVMFAQVLVKNPKFLLLDEPVSALDMRYQCILLNYVRKYTIKKDLITLMILHDISLAVQFADELIVLSDSKIAAKGSARCVLTQELIEKVYKVLANIFYDDRNFPVVVAKEAI